MNTYLFLTEYLCYDRRIASSLTLFIGDNTYAIASEVRTWSREFIKRHGAENLIDIDAKSSTSSDIFDAISAMPFIAEKRLIIVRGMPPIDKESIDLCTLFRDLLHPAAALLFVIPSLDKRLSVSKALIALCETKTFPSLSDSEILQWIRREFSLRSSTIMSDVPQTLLSLCGNDQWILHHEIEKLALASSDAPITRQLLFSLCIPSGSEIIWRFTDAIAAAKPREAMSYLHWRLDRGDDAMGLWYVLLSFVRNLALVSSALAEGLRTERSIAERTEINPMGVRSILSLARSLDPAKIASILSFAADAEIALKTGGFRSSTSDMSEVIALIERLILLCMRPDICRKA